MKNTLLIFALFFALNVQSQNQISELNKGLIFHLAGSEWFPYQNLVDGTIGTPTAIYNVQDKQGNGRRWYSFNGTSDYVALPTIAAFGSSDFSVTGKIKTGATGAIRTIIGGATNSFELYISATGYLTAKLVGASALTASTTQLTANTEYTFSYVRSGAAGSYYVNGLASGTTTDSNNYSVICTLAGNGSGFFNGYLFMLRAFNFALTTQIANYSKPEYPIEWVDRGATGAELMGVFKTAAYWDNSFTNPPWTTTGDTELKAINGSAGYVSHKLLWTIGKRYKTITVVTFSGSGDFKSIYDGGVGNQQITASGTYSTIYTPESTTGYMYKYNDSNIATVTSLSVTQLGCLLDLNAEGCTSSYWYDKTNSLTATVSGASLVIPPASNLQTTFFNGNTSKVVFTGMNGLTGITTISAQITPIALGGFIFDNTKVKLKVNSSGYLSFSRDGSTFTNSAAASIAINITYNVLITSTSTGVTNIYINGTLSGTANQSAGTPASGTTYNVGTDNTNYYNGLIKNLAINGEVLDLDRIKLLNDTNN